MIEKDERTFDDILGDLICKVCQEMGTEPVGTVTAMLVRTVDDHSYFGVLDPCDVDKGFLKLTTSFTREGDVFKDNTVVIIPTAQITAIVLDKDRFSEVIP